MQGCAGSQAELGAKEHGWSRASAELRSVLTPEGGVVSCWKATAGDTRLLWHICKERTLKQTHIHFFIEIFNVYFLTDLV